MDVSEGCQEADCKETVFLFKFKQRPNIRLIKLLQNPKLGGPAMAGLALLPEMPAVLGPMQWRHHFWVPVEEWL